MCLHSGVQNVKGKKRGEGRNEETKSRLGRDKQAFTARGRPAGNIGSAQIKNGAHSAVLQSGLRPLRRNGDKDDVRGGQHRHHTAKRLKD